jgi:hypothetical protein
MTPLLLLPLAFAAGDVPGTRPDCRAEREFYVLADLTPAEARHLEGKRARDCGPPRRNRGGPFRFKTGLG